MCKSNLNYSVPSLRLNRFWFSNNIHMVLIILTSNLCLSLCSFLFSLCVSFCLSLGLFLFTNKLRLQFLLFSCRFVRLCSLKSLALIFSWMSSLVSNPPSSSQMHASCSFFMNDRLFFGAITCENITTCVRAASTEIPSSSSFLLIGEVKFTATVSASTTSGKSDGTLIVCDFFYFLRFSLSIARVASTGQIPAPANA